MRANTFRSRSWHLLHMPLRSGGAGGAGGAERGRIRDGRAALRAGKEERRGARMKGSRKTGGHIGRQW
eukprot:2860820-Pyramimonas_sp.AAC.1